ncbi:MAG: DUF2628 domain-containing protein, partial [Alphaproteobacteria bacterium]|nr:DUF2628 domain-containing protein [Alphaproteobacteria bacterium]
MGVRVYTVHARPWASSEDGDAVFVREGYNWAAFVFGPLWALWHGMWKTAIGLLALSVVVSGMAVVVGMAEGAELAVSLGFQVAIGLWANDWRRHVLARRGFLERGVVA